MYWQINLQYYAEMQILSDYLEAVKNSKNFSCITRREYLVTRYFNDENIMTTPQTVSYIRSYANNDRHLRNSPE